MINLFYEISKINGLPLDQAVLALNKRKGISANSFEQSTQSMAWKIYDYHKRDNAHYIDFIGNQKIEYWNDIPILTKNDIQIPLKKRLSVGSTLKNCYTNNTSGSTGKPFFFAKDKFAHAMTWALIFDRFNRHGIVYGKSLQARFFGIPLSRKGYWKEKMKDYIAARERFPVFDLSDNRLEQYAERFSKTRFEYINGYTSSLVLFAKYLTLNKLVLKNICPTLKVCVTTSEMCEAIDREILRKGFGVPVVNEYGAAELDLIAFEDEGYDWIISSENLLVEILDEEDNPVPDGQEGRIIVTSLHNKAMPFIRYEIGDIGAINPQRKGIYPVLHSLQGRTNDVAYLPSGKKSPGLTFYYISKNLLEKGGFLKEFIIIQKELDLFHFEYIAERELTDSEKKQVCDMMEEYLEPGLRSSFERKKIIERTQAGKFKHFQSELNTKNKVK